MEEETVAELDEKLNVEMARMEARLRTFRRRLQNEKNSEDMINTYIDMICRINEILGELNK